jgi:hypothetical protein
LNFRDEFVVEIADISVSVYFFFLKWKPFYYLILMQIVNNNKKILNIKKYDAVKNVYSHIDLLPFSFNDIYLYCTN